MGKLEVLTYPDPKLRQKAEPVREVTPEIRRILNDMAETMYEAPGIGLAGPQVGVLQRIIVVDVGADEETGRASHLYKLVNPQIKDRSGHIEYEEGCLSIPDIREVVKRSGSVTVEALDEEGRPVKIEAEGLLAVCLQHEIDHLDGVLFTDRLSFVKRELIKSKLRKLQAAPQASANA